MYNVFLLAILLLPQQERSNRLLRLYTIDSLDTNYQKQLAALAKEKSGLEDRAVVVEKIIYNYENATVFKKHNITDSFTVVLIGKDGGEKYRSNEVLLPKKLFTIIDGMPMRKNEMREERKLR